jgi:putative phosphonate metabolism protein
MAPRYAIYYAPRPEEPLAHFGRAWLGYDAERGGPARFLAVDGIPADRHLQIVDEPRRYGFHGTLKAPFHLAEGISERELLRGVRALAKQQVSFSLSLRFAVLRHFLALVPARESGAVDGLAAECVRLLDCYRAPLDPRTLERRRKARLTERQEQYLRKWGYPYVFDEFRFHMTLTGRLRPAERPAVRRALSPAVRPFCAEPIKVRDLVVFVQPDPAAPFRVLARCPLGGR